MIERKLNEAGLIEFENFILELRNEGTPSTPIYLLNEDSTSEPIGESLPLVNTNFETRYLLGEHLVDTLGGTADAARFFGDRGFWSGLALFWFDLLCPARDDGSRKPSKEYNYILSENFNHRPRHSVFTTWQLVSRYGEDAKFLLNGALPVRGELVEQLMARQYLLSCEGVIRTASQLYYDPERNTYKKGAAARKSAGCIARYISWMDQLKVNYDLFAMSPDDFFSLMPAEFDRFRQA
ncbi:hypothetical protein [Marinobacterium aestuariivivens]|uniref:Uncharacterized protein n=1 Tax=Marinobacterium aestuariivivens TaxID=1698799 RepID=A0ABW2A344_9GAMM